MALDPATLQLLMADVSIYLLFKRLYTRTLTLTRAHTWIHAIQLIHFKSSLTIHDIPFVDASPGWTLAITCFYQPEALQHAHVQQQNKTSRKSGRRRDTRFVNSLDV